MCIYTFLESHNFSNKIIAPFCSNGGGGLSKTVQNIINAVPDAKVTDGLSINYSNLSESQLENWLNTI
jgi:flavodoxin